MKKIQNFIMSILLVVCALCPIGASAQTQIIPEVDNTEEQFEAFCAMQFFDFPEIEFVELTPYSETIPIKVSEEIRERVQTQLEELEPEAIMLAKLVYREAGGIKSKAEQAGVIWCVLNRVDCKGSYGNSISKVVKAKHQFAWANNTPVREDLLNLAKDVLTRWFLEKEGYEEVGRVLPENYFYFAGRKGHNWFRKTYKSRSYWDWSLENPYMEEE